MEKGRLRIWTVSYTHLDVYKRQVPDRADRTPEVGASDEAALQGAGRDGGAERESADAVGRADEQHPQSGGGSDTERADLQLSIATEEEVRAALPTVEEQIEMLVQAEEEKSSAFAISVSYTHLDVYKRQVWNGAE